LNRVVRTRPAALVPRVVFAALAILAVQLLTVQGSPPAPLTSTSSSTSPSTSTSVASTAVPALPVTTATSPAPTPPAAAPAMVATPSAVAAAPAAVPPPTDPSLVPPVGRATAWGCTAALTYLQAYAAKGFTLECPGYARGQEAMTCMRVAGVCPTSAVIAIADPCPQAYMNEASNSYVIVGDADTPVDPFGPCPLS
jgi:hypothetical protein